MKNCQNMPEEAELQTGAGDFRYRLSAPCATSPPCPEGSQTPRFGRAGRFLRPRHACRSNTERGRSTYYYQCAPEADENLALMRRWDELHLAHPVYGRRKLTVRLRHEGLGINRKRGVRLLRLLGITAIYAQPKLSLPAPGPQIYPYLLRDLEVTGPDQVWCADITYVPMARGRGGPQKLDHWLR